MEQWQCYCAYLEHVSTLYCPHDCLILYRPQSQRLQDHQKVPEYQSAVAPEFDLTKTASPRGSRGLEPPPPPGSGSPGGVIPPKPKAKSSSVSGGPARSASSSSSGEGPRSLAGDFFFFDFFSFLSGEASGGGGSSSPAGPAETPTPALAGGSA